MHKASAGAAEYMKVVRVVSMTNVMAHIRKQNVWLIGADMHAERSVWDEDLKGPVAFVIGGEDRGISPAIAERCDRMVKIPMKGHIRSLNVAATAAILFFEKRRQDARAEKKDGAKAPSRNGGKAQSGTKNERRR